MGDVYYSCLSSLRMEERLHILHIDDDPLFRRALRRVLERKGYMVTEASHGEEGFRRAHGDRPDLVVLDIRMPIQDGFETLRQLQEHEYTQGIPVVMCSSLGTKEDIAFCLRSGARGYLIKTHHHPEEMVCYLERFLA